MTDHQLQKLLGLKILLLICALILIGVLIYMVETNINNDDLSNQNLKPTTTTNTGSQSIIVLVKNSGSTNTPSYALTIYQDGGGQLVYGASPITPPDPKYQNTSYPTDTFQAARIKSDLIKIGDVSTIPIGNCGKSVSFGTKTMIVYNGITSSDISCPLGNDATATERDLISLITLPS